MTSAKLDAELREIGYFLVRRNDGDGGYWFVGSLYTHNGYNCTNLKEVKSMLNALRQKVASGGVIICEGSSDWICVED